MRTSENCTTEIRRSQGPGVLKPLTNNNWVLPGCYCAICWLKVWKAIASVLPENLQLSRNIWILKSVIKLNFLTPQYLYCRELLLSKWWKCGKRVHFHKVNDGILPHFCHTPYLYYMTSFQFVALFPSYSHFKKVVCVTLLFFKFFVCQNNWDLKYYRN